VGVGDPATGGFIPVVTGLIVGARTQLVNFGKTFDEDAGGARSRRSNRRRAIARTIARTAGAR
jgi:hypothetical protein